MKEKEKEKEEYNITFSNEELANLKWEISDTTGLKFSYQDKMYDLDPDKISSLEDVIEIIKAMRLGISEELLEKFPRLKLLIKEKKNK